MVVEEWRHTSSIARLDRIFQRWVNSDRGDIEGNGLLLFKVWGDRLSWPFLDMLG